jgi:hypothetical protein
MCRGEGEDGSDFLWCQVVRDGIVTLSVGAIHSNILINTLLCRKDYI